MALNLVRNSKVYFTTNVDSISGLVADASFTTSNTQELQVLDGFTFSQNTNADTITVSEAGAAPIRGQRAFNSSLAPVDFSMSTYIRPYSATSGTGPVTAEESVLWNAMVSGTAITAGVALGGTGLTATYTFASGVGTVVITGTGMNVTGLNPDDYVTIGGLTGGTAAGTIALSAGGKLGTVGTTSITIYLANPSTAAITVTVGTAKLYKCAWAPVNGGFSVVTTAGSNLNQLQKFGMIFVVDNATYVVDNCAMNQVVIDFGLDAISTTQWSGQGTSLREVSGGLSLVSGTNYTAKNVDAKFITNKLSTVSLSLVNALGNAAAAGTSYAVALTGGSITINNNIGYLTPANLGVVNVPINYYTGTRSITGSMTAYLKTGSGAGSTGQLLADMLAASTSAVEPMVKLGISIGGGTNTVKVVMDIPSAVISIPTVDVQAVVSTTINFTAEGYIPSATANANTFALDQTSDLSVRYYA